MVDHADPRASRSRAALMSVASGLLDHPVDLSLSVTEVAARAGVSRPTFYQHFADVPTLVGAAAVAELEQTFAHTDSVLAGLTGVDFLRGTNTMLVEAIYARRESYRDTLRGPASRAVLSATVGYVEERMRDNVLGAQLIARSGGIDADRITAIAAGATWLVCRWLDSGFSGADAPASFAVRLTAVMLDLAGIGRDSR